MSVGAATAPDPRTASAAELTAAYAAGTTTPVEVLEVTLAAAESAGERFNAVAVMNTEAARQAAVQSAQRWAQVAPLGPLDGVPVSVKDSFPMAGLKRWHGSALNDPLPPSARDGAPVRRLREAGALLFAKSSMPDFGLLAAGISSQFGIIRNPWNPDLNPGGSSSGAGALLAAGAGTMALGTDMGGSVRLPANQCGLVALKPTQGRIAYDPPKLIGSAGPMARTVADAAVLLGAVGQPDAADHLSLPGRFIWDGTIPHDLHGLEVGVLTETADGQIPVDPAVAAVVEGQARILEAHGARLRRLPAIMTTADIVAVGDVLSARGLLELAAAPPSMWDQLPDAMRKDLTGRVGLSALEYLRAEKLMEQTRVRLTSVYTSVDFVLSPVMPTVSFPAEASGPPGYSDTPGHGMFTMGYNVTSLPAGTLPVALSEDGMPIGVQVGGHRFDDGRILSLLALLEHERTFRLAYPVLGSAVPA